MAEQRDKPTPLSGVRVVNLGSQWASRLAAMLLAEQGAEVLEIAKPGRPAEPVDALLDRGKQVVTVDLTDRAARASALETARGADIVLENMRAGAADALGLGWAAFRDCGAVYVSMPGFAAGDPLREIAAWEGTIDASVGIYTDIAPLGPWIDGPPVYSAIPMASAYGGVLGAVAASLGHFHRLRTGRSQAIEVPLADAVFAAMALLAVDVEGQPARYNFPQVDNEAKRLLFPVLRDLRAHMSPEHVAMVAEYLRDHGSFGLRCYQCADDRMIFVCTPDHVIQTHAFLTTVGVFDQAIAEGMIAESAFSERAEGNNLYKGGSLSPEWRRRLIAMIEARIRRKPAAEWEALLRAAKVPVTVVQTSAEWLANPVYLDAGITTDLADPDRGPTRMAGRFISIEGERIASPALAPARRRAGTPGWPEETAPRIAKPDPPAKARGAAATGMLHGIKVLDFSNIIAGPAAGRCLAEHGAEVIHIDAPAPQSGPNSTVWFSIDVHQGKRAIILDLKTDAGRAALAPLIRDADVVLHNFLDHSAQSLGIAHDQLAAINPDIISCQVSAWGGADGGAYKDDPAFDPVLQAASGITRRFGSDRQPTLHGIASCVDYITGFSATLGIVQALIARANGHGGSYVRTALASGTQMVQFPYMVATESYRPGTEPSGQAARGDRPGHGLYALADGWAFIGFRPGDENAFAAAVGAGDANEEAIRARLGALTLAELAACLHQLPGASAVAPRSLARIRADRTVEADQPMSNWAHSGSLLMRRGPHPCGYPVTLPAPTWIRPEAAAISHLAPAAVPGQHTAEVLRTAGLDGPTLDRLFTAGVARSGWAVQRRFLPL